MPYIEPIAKGLEGSKLLHRWEEGDRKTHCCNRSIPIAFWVYYAKPQGYTVCTRQ